MIKYRLRCGGGHEFEAWFASSSAYEAQEAEHRLTCPHCARTDIHKALMAPRISTRRNDACPSTRPAGRHPPPALPQPAPQPSSALRPGQEGAENVRAMLREMRALRDEILARSEYVGPRFAEEARKIHHQESEDRAIHGEATSEEVRELAEDGIDVLPVPRLPDDLN